MTLLRGGERASGIALQQAMIAPRSRFCAVLSDAI